MSGIARHERSAGAMSPARMPRSSAASAFTAARCVDRDPAGDARSVGPADAAQRRRVRAGREADGNLIGALVGQEDRHRLARQDLPHDHPHQRADVGDARVAADSARDRLVDRQQAVGHAAARRPCGLARAARARSSARASPIDPRDRDAERSSGAGMIRWYAATNASTTSGSYIVPRRSR